MFHKIKYKLIKIFKLSFYKVIFGKRFVFSKINIRRSFIVELGKNGHIKIGKGSFFNNYCSINCMEKIEIGNDCLFGERVSIYDHDHIFNKKGLIMDNGFKNQPIIIGNNCWIGSNVIILKGTVIGNNVVIGAGIVINGTIPDNSIVKRKEKSFVIENIKYKD